MTLHAIARRKWRAVYDRCRARGYSARRARGVARYVMGATWARIAFGRALEPVIVDGPHVLAICACCGCVVPIEAPARSRACPLCEEIAELDSPDPMPARDPHAGAKEA